MPPSKTPDVKPQYARPKTCHVLYGIPPGELAERRKTHPDDPPFIKVGRRVLYPTDKFEEWLLREAERSAEKAVAS